MEWSERIRRYQEAKADPALRDAVENAYAVGYEEGAENEWATIDSLLDEFGDAYLLEWIKARLKSDDAEEGK